MDRQLLLILQEGAHFKFMWQSSRKAKICSFQPMASLKVASLVSPPGLRDHSSALLPSSSLPQFLYL